MNCVECGKEVEENCGTEQNPLCKPCYDRMKKDYDTKEEEANASPQIEKDVSKANKKKNSNLIGAVLVILILIGGYFTFGLFVIQPIGAVPDGATVLYWRLGTNMPFISSADGLLDKSSGGVSLLGRGLALGMAAKVLEGRKIVSLPYSSALYLMSTGGKTYESPSSSSLSSDYSNSNSNDKGIGPSDFEIVSHRGVWEGGRLRLKGEIKNNGNIPGGPKIEVIARDANGELIDSKQFWPNSVTNIPPGGTCGIEHTITRDIRAKTYEVKVIDVDVW